MRHEEKLLFISSCLISFSLFFLLGGKTMKLNSDAVAKRCCCKAMLLQSDAVAKRCCCKAMLLQSDVAAKRCCCKAMLLNNGAIR